MLSEFIKLGLTESHAQILFSAFVDHKKLASGKFFIKEGKVCHEIGIVTKGKCRHFYNTSDGEVTRWIALTNEFVTSLSSFVSQQPAKENIQAMESTEILVMPRAHWVKLYAEHDFIRQFYTRTMEANYIGMEERVFNLIAKSAEERYQWMQENQPRFIREVPDKYLASMLGVHPRHLSRIRAQRK